VRCGGSLFVTRSRKGRSVVDMSACTSDLAHFALLQRD
jgi:hypothetical protein